MIVNDTQANIKLTQNNIIQNLMKGFSKIQTDIASDALDEGVKQTDFLTKQFDLLDNIYRVASTFKDLKRVRTYFLDSKQITSTIGRISGNLKAEGAKYLTTQERAMIKNRLDQTIDNVKYSLELVTFAMDPSNKLSLAERLRQIDDANIVLSRASRSAVQQENLMDRYKYDQQTVDSKKSMNEALYN